MPHELVHVIAPTVGHAEDDEPWNLMFPEGGGKNTALRPTATKRLTQKQEGKIRGAHQFVR